MLAQLKVAALLAILDGRLRVESDDWNLASQVMQVSNDTRLRCRAELQAKAAKKTAARAAAQVATQAAVAEAQDANHNAVLIRTADRLVHLLKTKADRFGGWMAIRNLNQVMDSKEKKRIKDAGIEIADVLGDLIEAGKVESKEPEGREQGARYRAR